MRGSKQVLKKFILNLGFFGDKAYMMRVFSTQEFGAQEHLQAEIEILSSMI